MTDADKIVAAILAAGMCIGKSVGHEGLLAAYDHFITDMRERAKKDTEAQSQKR